MMLFLFLTLKHKIFNARRWKSYIKTENINSEAFKPDERLILHNISGVFKDEGAWMRVGEGGVSLFW